MRRHVPLAAMLVLATVFGTACNEQQDNTDFSRARVEPALGVGGAAARPTAIAPGAEPAGRAGGEPVPQAGTAGAPVADVGQKYTVNVMDGQYSPLALTIPNGSLVYFHNVGTQVHTVTALPGPQSLAVLPNGAQPFHSGPLPPGQTFVHRFVVPGTYRYYDQFFAPQGMVATINVEQGTQQRNQMGG